MAAWGVWGELVSAFNLLIHREDREIVEIRLESGR